MTQVFNCGFARVFLYETRALAISNLKKQDGETLYKFNSRVLNEIFRLFSAKFAGYHQFQIKEGKEKSSSL